MLQSTLKTGCLKGVRVTLGSSAEGRSQRAQPCSLNSKAILYQGEAHSNMTHPWRLDAKEAGTLYNLHGNRVVLQPLSPSAGRKIWSTMAT